MEGGEYGGEGRERRRYRECDEVDDDLERRVKELDDELKEMLEEKKREEAEYRELDDEFKRELKRMKDHEQNEGASKTKENDHRKNEDADSKEIDRSKSDGNEDTKEKEEDDYIERNMRELDKELERYAEEEKPEQSVKDAVRELAEEEAEMRRIRERMDELEEGREEREEQRIKDAIREVAEEDAELKRLQDQLDEMKRAKEDRLERDREERAESADKDKLDEFEKDILDNFESYGYDEEKVRELWRRRFEDDIEDELKEEDETSEKIEKEKEGDEKKSKTAEGYSTYQDGSGMAYAVKNESKESSEAASKTEVEETTEKEHHEQTQADAEGKTPEKKVAKPEHEVDEKPDVETSEVDSKKKTKKKEVAETSESEEVEEQTKTKTRKDSPSDSVDEIEEHVTQETTPKESQENTEVETETKPMKQVSEEVEEEQSSESVENPTTAKETDQDESHEGPEIEDDRQVSNESTGEGSESARQEDLKETESTKPDTSVEEGIKEVSDSNVEDDSEETEEQGVVYRTTRTFRSLVEDPREKEWVKYIESIFENLSEEDKEEFRRRIRGKLKTKEDFERLLRELGLEWRAEPENVEKANKFLKLKQEIEARGVEDLEKIAEELGIEEDVAREWVNNKSRPTLIDAIFHRLGGQEWSLLVQLKMHLSTPRSMEEVDEIIKQNPKLRELPYFEQMLKDVKAWIEIMDMKEKGMFDIITDKHGNEKFLLSEIKKLSLKYRVSESEVLDWLRGRSYPPLVDVLTKFKSSSLSVAKKSESQSAIPTTFEEFESLLKKHLHLRERKNFDKYYQQVKLYYAMKHELESSNLDHLSARKKWKYLSKKYEVSEYTIKGWFAKSQLPRLLRDVVNYEANPEQPYPKAPSIYDFDVPSSLAEFKLLLKRNPYIMERKRFDKMYYDIKAYFQMKEVVARKPEIGDSELSRMLRVSRTSLRKWRIGETQPVLLTQLMKNERLRRKLEHSIPNDAYRYWIDPSEVYQALRKLEWEKQVNIDKIAEVLKDLYLGMNPQRAIGFAHLRPYNNQHGPRWLLKVAKAILDHREDIMKRLNEKMGFETDPYHELRIAVVDNVLYFWDYQTTKFDPLNLFGDELFYFSKRERKRLTREARTSLGLKGDYHFSELVRQICNYSQAGKAAEEFIISDFTPISTHIRGNVLKFILSVTERKLNDIDSTISRVLRSRSTKVAKSKTKTNDSLRKDDECELHIESLSQVKDPVTVDNIYRIVSALEKLYSTLSPSYCVWFVHLKSYYKNHHPIWQTNPLGNLRKYRRIIERELNKCLHFAQDSDVQVRIAFLDETLYIWKQDLSHFDLPSLFPKEHFYLDRKDRSRLLSTVQRHFSIEGINKLNKLVRTLCDDFEISVIKVTYDSLQGIVLKFLLDATRKSIKEIILLIKKIGTGKQILNPNILNETKMQILLARLFAIISSDGSIRRDGGIAYYEKYNSRRQRVRKILSQIGNLHLPDLVRKDGTVEGISLPSVIGRLLIRLGIPAGDKVLQGVQLPDFIKYGSPEMQLAYLEELIPEEGWVIIDKRGYAVIGLSRTIILHDPEKGSKFGFVSKLTFEQIHFIYKHGKRSAQKSRKGSVPPITRKITMRSLRKLQESDDPDKARVAREIEEIALTNSPQHLDDEVFLCESNGIYMRKPTPDGVFLSETTGRVSVKWRTDTSSQADVAMWGLLALPNDVRKRSILKKWMKKNKERVNEAKEKLRRAEENIRRILESRTHHQKEGVEEV